MAIVLEGGLVQDVILQDWPSHIPLPRIVVVDYDTDSAEITRFPFGDEIAEAVCHIEIPVIYESRDKALSPNTVLAILDGAGDLTD